MVRIHSITPSSCRGASVVDVGAVFGAGDVFHKVMRVAEGLFLFTVLWHNSHLYVSWIQCFFCLLNDSIHACVCWLTTPHSTECRKPSSDLERNGMMGNGCHYSCNIHILSGYISYARGEYAGRLLCLFSSAADCRTRCPCLGR